MNGAPQTNHPRPKDKDIAQAIARELKLPLAAMRAVIGGLAHAESASLPTLIEGLLNELDRLDHGIGGLVELSTPHEMHPIQCTVGEVIRAAQGALPPKRKEQVLVALEGAQTRIVVDAVELERCLSSLLFDATTGTTEPVLLHSYIDGSRLDVTIIGGKHDTGTTIDQAVTIQELSRLGAKVSTWDSMEHAITISLPLAEEPS
jgi:signal transduction histidine kinase